MSQAACIIGVGGAGCGIVDHVVDIVGGSAPVVAVDTDASVISSSRATSKLQIGEKTAGGLGSGGDVRAGMKAAEDDAAMLANIVSGAGLVFVVTGLGGGAGTGATQVVLQKAREAGALTMCFATLPFRFEGRQKSASASGAVSSLKKLSDVFVAAPNDRLCAFTNETRVSEAFEKSRIVLAEGVGAMVRLVTRPGLMSLSFADLRNAMRRSGGIFTFGYGRGDGPDKAREAVNSLLGGSLISAEELASGAKSLLVSISGGGDLTLAEIERIMESLNSATGKDCNVAMGTVVDNSLENSVSVTALVSDEWNDGVEDSREEDPAESGVAKQSTFSASSSGGSGGRKKLSKQWESQQTLFHLEPFGRGRFKNTEPTILDGEDLDIPTFVRRGISIKKG